MNDHMAVKKSVSVNTLHGYIENIHYNLFCLREGYYITKIMYTYGEFLVHICQKESPRVLEENHTGEEKNNTLKYHDPFVNNLPYIHVINYNNNLRHDYP